MRGTGDFGLTLSSKIELALSIDATLLIDLDLNNDGVAPDSNGAGKSAALVLFIMCMSVFNTRPQHFEYQTLFDCLCNPLVLMQVSIILVHKLVNATSS